jgi:E3 ubiquitin-protein ligase listerin, N-terminal domain
VGKKLSKHLKTIIGPWMTAQYDLDRVVARAATESYTIVFNTGKKREIIRKNYYHDVYSYIMDVLRNETAKTISLSCVVVADLGDERFISAEDMEWRFALVVRMCLSGLVFLIGIARHGLY